jgi:hypothetical protein
VRFQAFLGVLVLTSIVFAQEPARAQTANGTLPQNPTCTVPKDEIGIIFGFLKQKALPHTQTVLVTETNANDVDVDSLSRHLEVKKNGLPSDLRADFNAKNNSSCLIGRFGGVNNLNFISKAEEARLFRVGSDEFHKTYGEDAIIVTVSRVAFNSDKTLGLLYESADIDHKAGDGTLYLLEKREDKWGVKMMVKTTFLPQAARP